MQAIVVPSGSTASPAFTLPRKGAFAVFVPSLAPTAWRICWATASGGPTFHRGWNDGVDYVVGSTAGPGVGRVLALTPWARIECGAATTQPASCVVMSTQ